MEKKMPSWPKYLIYLFLISVAFAPAIWTKQNWINPINLSIDSGFQAPRGTSTLSPWRNRDSIGQVMFRTTDSKFLGRFTTSSFKPFATEDSLLALRQYVFTTFSPGGSNSYIQNQTATSQTAAFRILNTSSITGGDLGVGTATPSQYYHGGTARVVEVNNTGTDVNSQGHFIISSSSTSDMSAIGTLSWMSNNTNPKGVAYIRGQTQKNTATQTWGRIAFATAQGGTPLERMNIDSIGRVGIGLINPQSNLHVNGSWATLAQNVTVNITLGDVHRVTVSNGANITITLPSPAACPGREYRFKKIINNSNTITLVPAAGNIETAASYTFSTYLSARTVWNDGVNWWVE